MPKAKRGDLAELRAQALERDGGCKWPGCDYQIDLANNLQMAHIKHRGMGGRTSVNRLDEVVILCALHHRLFDGETGLVKLRYELETMLRAQI